MRSGPDHAVEDIRVAPGELSFDAHVDGTTHRVWFRTDAPVTPNADAALVTCLLPAMRSGGTLSLTLPVSERILRMQREFQAIQCAWSLEWSFGYPPLREVEVLARARASRSPAETGRVAAFFSGGVDSWSTVLDHPELTDLIFVRGIDLLRGAAHQIELADVVEARLREAAAELGLPLHVVETNVRELADSFADWETYYGCALVAVALFVAPLFERVLIAGDSDYEVQVPFGANRMVDQLWSTEQLEILDDGGRHSRVERVRRVAGHPVVQRTLRVCWENRDGAYNCGRCRKCLMTMLTLEALGVRERITTFPPELDLAAVMQADIAEPVLLTLWEDVLDAARSAGRPDLESVLERAVAEGKRRLGLPPTYRRRTAPAPPPTVRIAVIVPVWRQPQFLAAAVRSALGSEIATGVGVVIVNDGCRYESTHRIAQTLRDADPDRVVYLRQQNGGLSSARNAGIRRALAHWPHVEAIFFLDADNQLSPQTLAQLWAVLEDQRDAAWATPAAELFGAEEGVWQRTEPYRGYRQLFSNQSDAGSLVRRSVFDAGIRFDETMSKGYEDWEFFLHATLSGFRGVLAGRCGFRYRRRPRSMVTSAARRDAELRAAIRSRHAEAYTHRSLARLEHQDAPRFALVCCDARNALLTAGCDLPPDRLTLPAFAERIRASGGGRWPVEETMPPITVLTTAPVVEWLDAHSLLAGALLRLQIELRRHPAVGLRIAADARPDEIELATARPPGDGLSAVAYRSRSLAGRLESPGLVLSFCADDAAAAPVAMTDALRGTVAAELGRGTRTGTPLGAPSHAAVSEALHIDQLETTIPWAGEPDGRSLLVLAPWYGPSRMQRWLPALMRAAKALDPRLSGHLVLTMRGVVEAPAEAALAPFDTVTSLAGADPEAAGRVLVALIGGADIVLHAGTPAGLIQLPLLESERLGRQIVLATTAAASVSDETPDLLAVRFHEPFIDAYVATSADAADLLANLDAVPDKVVLAPAEAEQALDGAWETAVATLIGSLEEGF